MSSGLFDTIFSSPPSRRQKVRFKEPSKRRENDRWTKMGKTVDNKESLPVYPRKTSRSKNVSVYDIHEKKTRMEDSDDEHSSERLMTFVSHTHGEKVIKKRDEKEKIIKVSTIPPHSIPIPSDLLK